MDERKVSQPEHVTIVDHDTLNYIGGNWASRVRRVSWGAILAGFISAAAIQLLLSILGLAVGLWSIDPMTDANSFSGLATGSGIYWLISGIISLFVGSCIAGYMCGVPDRWDGALHGIVIWGLLTLASFWYVGSTFGTLFSATTSALGNGLAVVADWTVPDNIGSTATNSQQQQTTFATSQVDFEKIGNELNEILSETGKEDLQPKELEDARKRLTNVSLDAAETVAKKPDSLNQQIDRVVGAFFEEWQQVKGDLDRDAAVNLLVANSEMSRQEASNTIDRWENEYQQAKSAADEAQEEVSQELQQLKQAAVDEYQEVKHATLKTTDELLDAIASAAMWSFFAMLLGLVSAVIGGAVGVNEIPKRFGRVEG